MSLRFICFSKGPLKMIKNAFYFIVKVAFVLKIFKCLLLNKQLQYTHCPASHDVGATKQ